MACFYWDRKLLGPVAAKRELGQLFDGKQYDQIKSISPEIAYQLYLLDCIIEDLIRDLSRTKQYIANLGSHMKFALFALIVRASQLVNAEWGSSCAHKNIRGRA